MDADSHARALKSLISGLAAPNIRHRAPFSITIPANIMAETLRYRYNEFIVISHTKIRGPALCIVRSRKSLRLGSLCGVFTVLYKLLHLCHQNACLYLAGL